MFTNPTAPHIRIAANPSRLGPDMEQHVKRMVFAHNQVLVPVVSFNPVNVVYLRPVGQYEPIPNQINNEDVFIDIAAFGR